MKVKCPICGKEKFESRGSFSLTKSSDVSTNRMNVFVCKTCGYVIAFDSDIHNEQKEYWPEVE